jgi:hypothetical protein
MMEMILLEKMHLHTNWRESVLETYDGKNVTLETLYMHDK